ncbi:hypothetical protein FH972_017041 [Carpinus fangiana]|uniref:Non-specific lipid-transfer protein n=1 Tax=Carpinus fangiana TaxID=176857 RepID=A0A5N6RJR7_9ROSI|nr:hypothetical protein FH972_017041 [Carpinus fangiana]
MGNLKLVCTVLLCMMVAAPIAQASLTCPQIKGNLTPCLIYLKNGGVPSVPCCKGVRAVNDASRTTPDRQSACNCLKDTARSVAGLNPNLAAGLPSKCGVNIPYKISPSTNCKNEDGGAAIWDRRR